MSASLTLSHTTGIVHLDEPFALHAGGTLPCAVVGFEVHGPEDGPPVVVLGGISASRDLQWWPGVVGRGCALDPDVHRLIGVDFLGGVGASTGPGGAGFPAIDTRDQARAILAVLDALGIGATSIVGASYGGLVALQLAALAPGRVDDVVVLAAAHRPHPLATAWRTVGRRILELARLAGRPEAGVALARALSMTTYRSARELDARFADDGLTAWLDHHGAVFARRFDAEAFRVLSDSIDRHRVEPEEIVAPITLVGFDTDQLVPVWLLDELAGRLPAVTRWTVPTHVGHDGFLVESEAVGRILRTALAAGKEAA